MRLAGIPRPEADNILATPVVIRAGPCGSRPDTLFPIDAPLAENPFCSRSRTFVYGIAFSAHRSHHGNSLWSQLSASIPRRKPGHCANSSAKLRRGSGLRHEFARSSESRPQRIYLHRTGDFLCAAGWSGAGQALTGTRQLLLSDHHGYGDLWRQRHRPAPPPPSSRRRRDGRVVRQDFYSEFDRPAYFSADWKRAASIAIAIRTVGSAGNP